MKPTLTQEMRQAADAAMTAHLRDVDANDQIGALHAALTAAFALIPEAPEGWKPISAHPQYGGWIGRCLFGKMREWGWSAWVGQCDNGDYWLGWDGVDAHFDCDEPTHYMDLPASPPPPSKGEADNG